MTFPYGPGHSSNPPEDPASDAEENKSSKGSGYYPMDSETKLLFPEEYTKRDRASTAGAVVFILGVLVTFYVAYTYFADDMVLPIVIGAIIALIIAHGISAYLTYR